MSLFSLLITFTILSQNALGMYMRQYYNSEPTDEEMDRIEHLDRFGFWHEKMISHLEKLLNELILDYSKELFIQNTNLEEIDWFE